jgi:chromosome segregation ATPase
MSEPQRSASFYSEGTVMTEQEIAALQQQLATLTTEKSDLQLEVANLQAQITALEESAETQGDRLTAALESVTALTTERATYTAVNTRLRTLIARGVSSDPDSQGMALEALSVIEESTLTAVSSLFAAEKSKLSE